MSRFTSSDTQRLPISRGDWIQIKKDLNTGDQKKLEACGNGIPVRLSDGTVHTPIDWAVYEIERAAIFLTDWSLLDDAGQPVKVNIDSLRALDPPDFDEINKAIFDHVVKRAAEKKALRADLEKTSEPPAPEPTSL